LAAERWQRKMMPLMRSGLMMLAAFFFVASLVQYHLLYQDLQKLTPGGRLKDPAKESIAIVESHLGRPIDRIDDDFMAWFKQVEKTH